MIRCRIFAPAMTALLILMAVGTATDSLAQQTRPRSAPQQPAAPPPPPPEPPPAAYEPDLLRLAEVLGSLAYLARLCEGQDQAWLLQTQRLIESEGTSPGRRERLAGAYNRGFIGYQSTHRRCNERSRAAFDELVQQGARLAREITTRYGA